MGKTSLDEQQGKKLPNFGAGLAITDIGCQRGDFVDDHHHHWLINGRGVKSGVPAQSCCASAHEICCRP